MTLYDLSVPQFTKMLGNLERWLEAAGEFAQKKKFEPSVLLQARLAPDQFPLVRQVQSVCDAAKFGSARLTGKDPPKHPDVEQSLEELRQRARACVTFLESLRPADFEGAEARKVVLPFMPDKFLYGKDYLVEFVLPNFYFHATTAYAILRHNGLDLGKMDFLGSLKLNEG
ncbi:MAG TPA: DUF1993 domain-containing protein [Polyangiaceae bacterium]|nr:DUF1993 domain-containing protein [Polyangiaceae bacterium]